jgi:hypothetical protein
MTRSPDSPRDGGRDATPIAPLGPGMVSRRVSLPSPEVVFLKGILEAHDGLAQVYAEKGGQLTICTTTEQAGELDALLTSLSRELPTMLLG